MSVKRWTKEEDNFIVENKDVMTRREIAKKLNRSYDSVKMSLFI